MIEYPHYLTAVFGKCLTVNFDLERLPELRQVLDRAMNTWEPQDQPFWLQDLSDLVDKALAK